MDCSIADRVVSAISCPWVSAATNALSVFGFASAHDLVTTYPWIGNSSVAPWLRSDRVTAPYCCSAAVANGSGIAAAATFPAASAAAITGKGIGCGGESHRRQLDPILGQHRGGQQIVNVEGGVDAEYMALQPGQGLDLRVRHRVDRLRALLHHRALGDDLELLVLS